jgi:hypothetical protein
MNQLIPEVGNVPALLRDWREDTMITAKVATKTRKERKAEKRPEF